MKNSVDK